MTAVLDQVTHAPAPVVAQPSRLPRPGLRLALLAAVALAAVAAYFWHELPLHSSFVVNRRLTTIATMAVVAVAIGLATVLFHTVSANHILTPSIMGLDSLYLALQTASVFVLGIGVTPNPVVQFVVVLVAMVGSALLLFDALLVRLGRSLHLMVLVGVLLGGLLRGVSSFLQRLLDPQAFQVLSDRFFADFTGAHPGLLGISAAIVGAGAVWAWARRRQLDVLALGPELATSLGIDHRRASLQLLTLVTLLVGTATALVGPTMFFGLLVAHAAYRVLGTHRHAFTLPGSALAGIAALVGGQLLFERILGFEGSLSMVIEFVGGAMFLVLLLRGSK